MITKLLIANRGEIACRIIRTAKRLGLQTVAVYSEIDAGALHVKMADQAIAFRGVTAKETYLNSDLLIQATLHSGADAIHPGYGFLSESADFAEAVQQAGIIFVGPPVEAIRQMGSKAQAKILMEKQGIPLIPGYQGFDQTPETLLKTAIDLGFPILIKAAAGGGGKGMRLVSQQEEFLPALSACCREAMASFKDDRVILEKYLSNSRHIEVQIFADQQGNTVHLFERDCSVQRRYQKIIEEAPAPNIPESLRLQLGSTAVSAAKAIGYYSAGTPEFLLTPDHQYYFMEMNTRLQVEHPITEMITGLDLVEWQLRVANGEPLPLTQSQIHHQGHAIEARLYAEDPAENFLPTTGMLECFQTPEKLASWFRLETGVKTGDVISVYYDSLLAKLCVWGNTRTEAILRFNQILDDCHIIGVTNNLGLLRRIFHQADYIRGTVDTGLLEKNNLSLENASSLPSEVLAAATWLVFYNRTLQVESWSEDSDYHSLWNAIDHFRLNHVSLETLSFDYLKTHHKVDSRVTQQSGDTLKFELQLPHQPTILIQARKVSDRWLEIQFQNQPSHLLFFFSTPKEYYFYFKNQEYLLKPVSFQTEPALDHEGSSLTAPMPGTIIEILVNKGTDVQMGEALITLEAMKMVHTIKAPFTGKILEIPHTVGESVEAGAELLAMEEAVHDVS